MKYLVAFFMLTSVSVYSSELSLQEVLHTSAQGFGEITLSKNDAAVIIKAIKNEMNSTQFKCTGTWVDQTQVIPALDSFKAETGEIKLMEDNTSPVITITMMYTTTFKGIFTIGTTPDLKKVTSFFYQQGTTQASEVNEGTLVRPVFVQKKDIFIPENESTCKAIR